MYSNKFSLSYNTKWHDYMIILGIFSSEYDFKNLKRNERMNNNDDPTASIIHFFLPLSNISRFSTSFYCLFQISEWKYIWLKLKTCYINENIQDERPSMKQKSLHRFYIKNYENIYMMYTVIYGASFYFSLPHIWLYYVLWSKL